MKTVPFGQFKQQTSASFQADAKFRESLQNQITGVYEKIERFEKNLEGQIQALDGKYASKRGLEALDQRMTTVELEVDEKLTQVFEGVKAGKANLQEVLESRLPDINPRFAEIDRNIEATQRGLLTLANKIGLIDPAGNPVGPGVGEVFKPMTIEADPKGKGEMGGGPSDQALALRAQIEAEVKKQVAAALAEEKELREADMEEMKSVRTQHETGNEDEELLAEKQALEKQLQLMGMLNKSIPIMGVVSYMLINSLLDVTGNTALIMTAIFYTLLITGTEKYIISNKEKMA